MSTALKYLTMIICLFMVISCCTACGGKDAGDDVSLLAPDINKNCFIDDRTNLVPTEQGYYYYARSCIYFLNSDFEKTILCSKPQCKHRERNNYVEDCDAYIKDMLLTSMSFYDNHLYYITLDDNTYDASLCRCNADGSEHENLLVIDQAAGLGKAANRYTYDFWDKHIYISQSSSSETEKQPIYKISLKTGEKETIYTAAEETGIITKMRCYDGCLFFSEICTEGEETKNYCTRLDLSSGKFERIMEIVNDYTIDTKNNILYGWVMGSGLYKVDLTTLKSTQIYTSDADTVFARIACDGEYIYMDNYLNSFYTTGVVNDEKSVKKIIVCSTEGEVLNEIKLPQTSNLDLISESGLMILGSLGNDLNYISRSDILNPNASWTLFKYEY